MSSSVSLAQFCLTLPLISFQLPSTRFQSIGFSFLRYCWQEQLAIADVPKKCSAHTMVSWFPVTDHFAGPNVFAEQVVQNSEEKSRCQGYRPSGKPCKTSALANRRARKPANSYAKRWRTSAMANMAQDRRSRQLPLACPRRVALELISLRRRKARPR